MDVIRMLFEFITDARRKITHKIVLGIVAVFILLLINDTLGFTYFYRTNKKIEQIKSIRELLKDTTLSIDAKNDLLAIELRTVHRKYWIDQMTGVFDRSISKSASQIDTVYIQDGKILSETKNTPTTRNPYWHFLSSSWLWLVVLFFVPFSQNAAGSRSKQIANIISGIVILIVISFIWSWLFGLIPIIGGKPWLNYIINFFSNLFFLAAVATAQKKS